jgi:hypothetical protein
MVVCMFIAVSVGYATSHVPCFKLNIELGRPGVSFQTSFINYFIHLSTDEYPN